MRLSRNANQSSLILISGLLFIPVFLLFPILGSIVTLVFLASLSKSKIFTISICVTLVIIVLGWMNSHKGMSGDWIWYTSHYQRLLEMPFLDYWGHRVGPFNIKLTEPVYYFISYLTSRISGANIAALSWIVTLLIYIPHGFSLGYISFRSNLSSFFSGLATTMALLVGITFTLTTQLIRQEIAVAFLTLGFILIFSGRKKTGWLCLVASLATHNSITIPFVAVLGAAIYVVKTGRIQWHRLILFASILFMMGLGYVYGPQIVGQENYQPLKNDGSISVYVIFMDICLLGIFLRLRSKMSDLGMFPEIIASSAIVYACFLVGVAAEPLPLLRMYFYIEVFRAFFIVSILGVMFRSKYSILYVLPAIVAGILYFEARIASSPFRYGGGLIRHLFSPVLFY